MTTNGCFIQSRDKQEARHHISQQKLLKVAMWLCLVLTLKMEILVVVLTIVAWDTVVGASKKLGGVWRMATIFYELL